MLPVYSALHTIPPILFRSKSFRAHPTKILLKSFFGTLRSCSFLATFVMLFQGLVCTQRNVFYALDGKVPEWVMKIWLHKGYYWASGEFWGRAPRCEERERGASAHSDFDYRTGFLTCISLFIEEKKRRGELAMYVAFLLLAFAQLGDGSCSPFRSSFLSSLPPSHTYCSHTQVRPPPRHGIPLVRPAPALLRPLRTGRRGVDDEVSFASPASSTRRERGS